MARGWESKAVESQIEDIDRRGSRKTGELTAEARALEQQRAALSLSRARVVAELDACRTDARRMSLEAALAFLDSELARLA